MLPIDDPRWKTMCGGYRMPYDPRERLRALAEGRDQSPAWSEFWNKLHHQGHVGEASYAVVPHLIAMQKERGDLEWDFYALVTTIEVERHHRGNPVIPDWLLEGYQQAWTELGAIALRDYARAGDPITQRAILAALALSKGLTLYGALLISFDESEVLEILDTHMNWSHSYRE